MKDFKDLSKAFQKRRIVKDAIKQIELGIVTPNHGTYFNLELKFDTKNLQKILQQKQVDTCTACAKGALFAACVLNVNKVNTNQFIDIGTFQVKKLKQWFSVLELNMMETAFEKEVIVDNTKELYDEDGDHTQLAEACIAFGKQYNKPKERLLAILYNVLENGSFNPVK